jgi:hypothetical protein
MKNGVTQAKAWAVFPKALRAAAALRVDVLELLMNHQSPLTGSKAFSALSLCHDEQTTVNTNERR